jgi:hypothetical protein
MAAPGFILRLSIRMRGQARHFRWDSLLRLSVSSSVGVITHAGSSGLVCSVTGIAGYVG